MHYVDTIFYYENSHGTSGGYARGRVLNYIAVIALHVSYVTGYEYLHIN